MTQPAKLVTVSYVPKSKEIPTNVFTYKDKVLGQLDGSVVHHDWRFDDFSKWRCVQLFLISNTNENIVSGDKAYNTYDGRIWEYKPAPCRIPYWGNISTLRKILATPSQIGTRYVNEKMGAQIKDFYTAYLTTDELQSLLDSGGNCEVGIKGDGSILVDSEKFVIIHGV